MTDDAPTTTPTASPVDMSHATPELLAALCKAQQQAETVGKDGTNNHQRYRYATADAMVRAARMAMASTGLALIAGYELERLATPLEMGKQWASVIVHESWVLTHESGGWIAGTASMPAIESQMRPTDKAAMAAQTYMHGFVLRNLLLLDRDEEDTAVDRRDDAREREAYNGPRRTERRRDEGPRQAPRAPRAVDPAQVAAGRAELKRAWLAYQKEMALVRGIDPDWSATQTEVLGEPAPKMTTDQMAALVTELDKRTTALAEADGPQGGEA